VDDFKERLKEASGRSQQIEAERRQDDIERREAAGTCHRDLLAWLHADVCDATGGAITLVTSRAPQHAGYMSPGARTAFPVTLTWQGTPVRGLCIGVDTELGWIGWALVNDQGVVVDTDADQGVVDPRDFQTGLEDVALRLVTTPEVQPPTRPTVARKRRSLGAAV
jgi:hypothetical protein